MRERKFVLLGPNNWIYSHNPPGDFPRRVLSKKVLSEQLKAYPIGSGDVVAELIEFTGDWEDVQENILVTREQLRSIVRSAARVAAYQDFQATKEVDNFIDLTLEAG